LGKQKQRRRAVLTLGAAVVGVSLFGASNQIVGAQGSQPPPAQIPLPSGPSAAPAPSTGTLTQGVWLWQRTEYGDGTRVVSADPSKYTLGLLAEGRLTIQADCNRGTGTYTVSGSQITLMPGAMTLAACPPGSQDSVFLRDLGQVVTYVMAGENLVLNLRIDGGNMIFSPQPPASLTGAWRVQSVNNGRGGVVSVLADTQLSVTFGEDGSVSGETGCNTFAGQYTVTDTTIAFGPLATTRRACLTEAAAAQEQAFLAALAASTRFELDGNRLTLRNDAGATQVVLGRAPMAG
jgi:heat shock protein HslJ